MAKLERVVGSARLTLYGIGSMLGAGIYGLVGKAAGGMGGAVWMAVLVAVVAAGTVKATRQPFPNLVRRGAP